MSVSNFGSNPFKLGALSLTAKGIEGEGTLCVKPLSVIKGRVPEGKILALLCTIKKLQTGIL